MKKHFSLFAFVLCALSLFAQNSSTEDGVAKINSDNMSAFRQGEVIVKFKDDCRAVMHAPQRTRFTSAKTSTVDKVFATIGVDSIEELMPKTGSSPMPNHIRAYNGQRVELKNLGKLYRLILNKHTKDSMDDVISKLQALEEIEYAEPNYIVYGMSTGTISDSVEYCAEPLYSQQWGLNAINLPYLWNQPKVRKKRPIIAILDTGVDIEHPDLSANIWTNELEANGIEDQDDDDNGFKDDIHGYDFINNTGNISDHNGHGTHCAGIASAVGNNGIGITGANPDALIMPVTVLQSDGNGDVATVIKGIDYATANGADIISMSFGGYAHSVAEEQALARAYATAILVAAAGNDNLTLLFQSIYAKNMYPAAFTFVLGVEASSDNIGTLASFSNVDADGPIYSTFGDEKLYNYELRAPGVDILSTFPGGRYKKLNGTSMACPMVAGAISRLLQVKTDSALVSKEVLFGDLIHSRSNFSGNIDMKKVYDYSDMGRKPTLWLIDRLMTDTIDGDKDNQLDAGETIEIYPIFRNDWGMAKNIRFWAKFGYYEGEDWVDDDTTLVHCLTDTVDFGKTLSTYAKSVSANPWLFRIDEKCPHKRHINMTFFATCDGMQDTLTYYCPIVVYNAVEIGGVSDGDLTLHPNRNYFLSADLLITKDYSLTILPGTTIDMNGHSISIQGHNSCVKGKPDSLIIFDGGDKGGSLSFYALDGWGNYADTIDYCLFQNFNIKPGGNLFNGVMRNCEVKYVTGSYMTSYSYTSSIATDFKAFYTTVHACEGIVLSREHQLMQNCNIIDNVFVYSRTIPSANSSVGVDNNYFNNLAESHQGGIKDYLPYRLSDMTQTDIDTVTYYGTGNSLRLRENTENAWVKATSGKFLLSMDGLRKKPHSTNHGVVWKILIDGYDAQDEFEQIPPLGVGTHTCQVYFNRAMDTVFTPYVSYGVRPPYTQHSMTNGSWSSDSTSYTMQFNIDAKTVSDGLNRLYVANAQDIEHFEIPIENMRFNMQIEVAGSLSTGLMATPGLGKVILNWKTDEEDFADLLGYNIYRWTNDTVHLDNSYGEHTGAGWKFDTIMVNKTLIDSQDSMFVDYDVVPGKSYYYIIKQITTSLNSYILSNPVAATPLTASKGDANGSMTVDVADVVTEIAYLTNDNPQPFIFEAADVNSDGVINILDVVGTINIITHPQTTSLGFSDNNTAVYTIEDGILYVETPVVLGGVQFTFIGNQQTASFQPLEALQGFEQVSNWTDSDTYTFLAYSMSGKTLGIGKHALLRIGDAAVENIVLSNPRGQNVPAIQGSATAISVAEAMQMQSAYPNPFTTEVIIPYIIGQTGTHNVRFVFTNVAGLVVDTYSIRQTFGEYTYTWHPATSLPAGVYFVTLYVDDKALQVSKLVRSAE